jgi:hypothetical protein
MNYELGRREVIAIEQGILQEIYGSSNTVQNNSNELKRGIVAITPPSYLKRW